MSRDTQNDDQDCLELFHRALEQCDELAWECIQQRYRSIMLHWLRRHPQKKMANRFESEENYVALGFERFWQATACNRHIRFNTLAAVMDYLRASLNSAVLDTLRTYARPHLVPLPDDGDAHKLSREDQDNQHKVWEMIQDLLTNERERRVAYLLYHCGLKPRQMLHYCPQEFNDVHEIYRIQRNILERLVRNADIIHWRLST